MDPNLLVYELLKEAAIKVEVGIILKPDFIYLVLLIERVSNLVHLDKKYGNLWVCIEFQDLDETCPKGNFPMPFIDQIINEFSSK